MTSIKNFLEPQLINVSKGWKSRLQSLMPGWTIAQVTPIMCSQGFGSLGIKEEMPNVHSKPRPWGQICLSITLSSPATPRQRLPWCDTCKHSQKEENPPSIWIYKHMTGAKNMQNFIWVCSYGESTCLSIKSPCWLCDSAGDNTEVLASTAGTKQSCCVPWALPHTVAPTQPGFPE